LGRRVGLSQKAGVSLYFRAVANGCAIVGVLAERPVFMGTKGFDREKGSRIAGRGWLKPS
jgi:hypothetical protein